MISKFFSFIPLPWKIAIGLALTVGLVGGTAWFSYRKGLQTAELQLALFAEKNAKLETKLLQKNNEINEKEVIRYQDRVKVVHDKETKYVDVITNIVPSQFNLSQGWVYTHDKVAKLEDVDPNLAADKEPSKFKETDALAVVTRNYDNCEVDRERLRRLQSSINEWNAAADKAKMENK